MFGDAIETDIICLALFLGLSLHPFHFLQDWLLSNPSNKTKSQYSYWVQSDFITVFQPPGMGICRTP